MRFRRFVVPVVLFVMVAGLAFAAYQVSDHAQGSAAEDSDNITVENETIMQVVGEWQYVQASQERYTTGFDEDVTVYNHEDQELTEGEDYEWNGTHGTVYFYDTANTDNTNSSNITYSYYQNTQDVKQLGDVVGIITAGLGRTAFLAGGLGLVVFLIVIGGLIARNWADSGPRSNR